MCVALRFYNPFSAVGRFVGVWTRSRWIHVGIEHSINEIAVVTEATNAGGVVVRRAVMAREPDAVVKLPWLENRQVTSYLSQYWGSRYGWRDVFGFVTNSNHNFGGIHCAELVSLMLATSIPFLGDHDVDASYEPLKALVSSKPPYKISPADLAHAVGLTD